MRKSFIFSFFFIAIAACSMPETNIYSLYLPVEKNLVNKQAKVSVAVNVKALKYLSQPYIVHRDSPYSLEIGKYSKWYAAPNEIIKDAFKERLASAGLFKEVVAANFAPADFYSLRINLTGFERVDTEGGSFGKLAFDAEFYSPEGKRLYRRVISKEKRLEDKGFLSLAKGLSAALSEGLEEVKADIITALPKSE